MKPIVIEGSWEINAPRQRLYEIVTDFEHAHKYFPIVAGSLKITKKKGNTLTIDAVSKTFGIPFHVAMETQLVPDKGFTSINTSILAVEDESFLMEDTQNGTRIHYRNEVQIKNNFLKLLGKLLIGNHALRFWKYAYIDRLEKLAHSSS